MSNPFSDAITTIEGLWTANWGSHPGVTILWHHNSSDVVPSRADTTHWLHVAVEFDEERAIAFGGGPGNIERTLTGCVVIRVFSARGIGESTTLSLLDDALNVFRSTRTGGLSIIGSMPLRQPGASDDGGWWIRSAIAVFTYRFRG